MPTGTTSTCAGLPNDTGAVISAILAHHVFLNHQWLAANFGSSAPATTLS